MQVSLVRLSSSYSGWLDHYAEHPIVSNGESRRRRPSPGHWLRRQTVHGVGYPYWVLECRNRTISPTNQKKEDSILRERQLPPETRVLSRRTLRVDGERRSHALNIGPSALSSTVSEESSVTYLRCLGSGRLHAYFAGEKRSSKLSIKMLEGISREVGVLRSSCRAARVREL